MGAFNGNKWWGSIKYRIRDFAIKYDGQLKLDRAKKVKSLDDRLSHAVEREDSLDVDLAKWDLERKASERYKGFVVRSRLNRVSKEAMKCNTFMREEEVQRFPNRYIKFDDEHALRLNHEMHRAFQAHFRDRFARCPVLPVPGFCSYLAEFPGSG